MEDSYTRLDIVRCASGPTVQAVRELIAGPFLDGDARDVTDDDLVGGFASYALDVDEVQELFDRLAAVGGDLALQLRTEHETGEPGMLFAYTSGTGRFQAPCDRAGQVLVPADRLAVLAACRSPKRRAALAEELTGRRVLDALRDEPARARRKN
ncbi:MULTISPECIES: hypothetical protein [unclassified Streptomyces]|uniref:Uncharacterized protein n=1 Tax=Streptomyces sp. F12 TaxID=1436084 RepID=V9Z7Q1_9ACTN|nr:hypothetical protein [Streptomyces sp. F12]AHE40148.1 hypothetical protein pFRL6_61 [Streptomyces sp. F12]